MNSPLAISAGARLYLDANIFIYFVEGHPAFANALALLFRGIDEGSIIAVTSELTLAEVLVKPLADGKPGIAEVYENVLATASKIQMTPVSRDLLLASARLRAEWGGKLFDAIHIATALASNCDILLTEDRGIRTPPALTILRVGQLTAGI
jgi:predicted nucleic acid-binding protein